MNLLEFFYGHRAEIFLIVRGYWNRHLDDCGWHESTSSAPTPESRRRGVEGLCRLDP